MENLLKAYWQGTLSCDFFTLPGKPYTAASRRGLRFHFFLHAQCRPPLECVRQCPHGGIAVSGEDSVRGYEYEDSLVVVSDQDLASLPQAHEPVIVLRQRVHAHAVDLITFDRAFYVEPGAGAKRAFALLVEVPRQSGMVALGTANVREHERLIVPRPSHEALILHALFAPTDMLSPERLALSHCAPYPIEIKAAQEWVARLSSVYVPEQWVDHAPEVLSARAGRKAKIRANRVPVLSARARRESSSPLPRAAA